MNTAITKTETKRDIRTLLQSDAVKQQLALVLPRHMTPDRVARVACTAVLKTPKLLECRPESLLQALMLCAQAGLEPDGRNAHLIPYGDQVQAIFDYKGLVSIAERNGVECIYADKVCANDEFNAWVEGGEKKLTHKIDWRGDRGEAYAYYASCRRNNRLDYEVMQRAEIDAIRKRSRASNSGPWVTDFDEMAKKTVLRRMSKRWDLTAEVHDAIMGDADRPADIRMPAIATPSFLPTPEHPVLGAVRFQPHTTPEPAPQVQTEVSPTPVVETPVESAPALSLQDQLEALVSSAGATFTTFVELIGNKLSKDASSWTTYAEVPDDVCKTVLRSKTAAINKLKT